MSKIFLRNAFLAVFLSTALAACGSGSSSDSTTGGAQPKPTEPTPNQPPSDDPGDIQPPIQEPAPQPEPTPEPAPEPSPDPQPSPKPNPKPQPTPEPEPQPDPEPELPPLDPEPTPADPTALLQWDAPTTRVDNTCLPDLAAFRISYGTSSGYYTHTLDVPLEDLTCKDSGTTSSCGRVQACSFLVEDLDTSSWYFAVQALDSGGNLSDYSGEAVKTVQ